MSGGSPSSGTLVAQVAPGASSATVVAAPAEYWNYAALHLYYKDKTDLSIDNAGAAKYKKTATAPLNYVKDLQADLISLGYLAKGSDDGYYGPSTARAVARFQRHAARVWRMKGGTPDDVSASDVFAGAADGGCKADTAAEVRKWIGKGWAVPVGRFKTREVKHNGATIPLTGGGSVKLRDDAAAAWEKIVADVAAAGGTLLGSYGDSLRPLRKTGKVGTSGYSFHYTGRAVDIDQAHTLSKGTDGNGRRYWVAQDPSGGDMYWTIYCKTDKQDGTQGFKITAKTVKWYSFSEALERYIPEGYYINLTREIQSSGTFERIKAQSNWASNYNKTEWWHFQYVPDKQPTFQDELELIGYTEDEIRKAGWSTDAELDHPPG